VAERSIDRAIAERLARAVDGLGGPVPVDLGQLAAHLGVIDITHTEMTEDGRTTWEAGRPRVELRSDRPASRSRFTLAHELGHILLDRDERVARRTRGLEHDDVEALCDWIAASILMPRSWISPYAKREQFNLSLLRLIANRADVSLAAAAVRLAEVSGRTCMLLRWQRGSTRWLVVGQAAVPRDYAGGLQTTSETSGVLDALPRGRDVWQELTLDADGRRLVGRAHVDRSGQTCLTLFVALSSID
jgi:hypothetical protein